MPHLEIPAFAGMKICTIRTVLTYRIVDNDSLYARIGIPLHVIPGPDPGSHHQSRTPEIPAFAGMTKCTIRTVLMYRVVDNGSLHAWLGIPPARHPGPDLGSHHQSGTSRSRRSPG